MAQQAEATKATAANVSPAATNRFNYVEVGQKICNEYFIGQNLPDVMNCLVFMSQYCSPDPTAFPAQKQPVFALTVAQELIQKGVKMLMEERKGGNEESKITSQAPKRKRTSDAMRPPKIAKKPKSQIPAKKGGKES